MSQMDVRAGRQELEHIEQVLEHFNALEEQFQQIRDGLTQSHRLVTLGTVATTIAHEYNNLLTPVVTYAQMALAKPDDHALMKKAVEKALAGAERAAAISASLLGFAHEQHAERTANLRQVFEESINCLGRHPAKDGIDLELDLPAVDVAISPLNLQQVFVNLFLNARRAMGCKGGTLSVRGELAGGEVRIEVSDTGPGIPPEIVDRLFEPFATHARDETPPGERKGTGLGLCICRELCRSAGGSIEVAPRAEQGACFVITLPVAEDLLTT